MSIFYEERPSDSPFVKTITQGYTASAGATTRPAEINWHMVLVKENGKSHPIVTGPWSHAGPVSWGAGAEILWIRFEPGVFMSHLPTKLFLNSETILPQASSKSFWLNSAAWEFPTFENVDTFLHRLKREEVLLRDPLVEAVLQGHPHEMSPRTVRHRFLHSTGHSHTHIRQVQRAQQAEALLQEGKSILDTMYEVGYFDQPHMTRSMKQFIGYTPTQIIEMSRTSCHSIQDETMHLSYDTNVLRATS